MNTALRSRSGRRSYDYSMTPQPIWRFLGVEFSRLRGQIFANS